MECKEFLGVEDVWFWFCITMASKQYDGFLKPSQEATVPRNCDINTIYKILKQMKIAGLISNKHLRVMVYWGQKHTSPLYEKKAKYSDKKIWQDGLSKLESVLIERGILNAI